MSLDVKQVVKCCICGEVIAESLGKLGDYAPTDNGDIACEGCRRSELERATVINRYTPSGKTTYKITAHFSFDSTNGDEIPADVRELFSRPVWHRTDGWRGYDDVKLTAKGLLTLEPIARGWVTDMPDSTVSHKAVACDLAERLKELDGKVPFTIWWVFSVTSNLFSLASDLYVAKGDMPTFKRWCKEQGFTVEAIARAFE